MSVQFNRKETHKDRYSIHNKIFVLCSYSVDFDEEFSALFGGVLDDQSIYLELCIKAVLNLYRNLPNPPTSVSIVAHSMVKLMIKH